MDSVVGDDRQVVAPGIEEAAHMARGSHRRYRDEFPVADDSEDLPHQLPGDGPGRPAQGPPDLCALVRTGGKLQVPARVLAAGTAA